MSEVSVVPVTSAGLERAFIDLPYRLHRHDPLWVAPLRSSEVARWKPDANPSLRRVRATRFVARSGGRVIGRVAAMLDPLFAERWETGSGFFGFLEFAGGPDVPARLLAAAEGELASWGCRAAIGPVAMTTHEEVGLLVDGFGRSPVILQPYQPRTYVDAVEAAGYAPYREYGAWEWRPELAPSLVIERLERMRLRQGGSLGGVRVRAFDDARFDAEVARLRELYNAAFADVWGFTPISKAEFDRLAGEFRAFYRPEMILVAEEDGEAVGFAVVLPDVNEALARLRGRLLPFGWLRLVFGLRRIRGVRFLLLGVRPEHHGRAIAPLLVLRMREVMLSAGVESVDVSLVQLDNRRMLSVVEALGCERTRVFRLYRRELDCEERK